MTSMGLCLIPQLCLPSSLLSLTLPLTSQFPLGTFLISHFYTTSHLRVSFWDPTKRVLKNLHCKALSSNSDSDTSHVIWESYLVSEPLYVKWMYMSLLVDLFGE